MKLSDLHTNKDEFSDDAKKRIASTEIDVDVLVNKIKDELKHTKLHVYRTGNKNITIEKDANASQWISISLMHDEPDIVSKAWVYFWNHGRKREFEGTQTIEETVALAVQFAREL